MDVPQSLSAEELRLFSERIARSLRERPLDLEMGAHRERIAELLRQVGEATWYQLLAVGPTDSELTIHAAYERLARVVHPQHARNLGLIGKEGVLQMLFERATQAYLTLTNPEERKAYDREIRPDMHGSRSLIADRVDRLTEARDLAKEYFARATALAEEEQYHFAIELLQQAVRADPKAEYYALLGRLQAMNPNPRWLRAAGENLEQAIRRGADAPDLRAALEEVRSRMVMVDEPKAQFEEEDVDLEVLDPSKEIAAARKGFGFKKKGQREGEKPPKR